jgi:uncharacterized protein
MGERTGYEHGTFSWTDLGTSDAGAAAAWYRELFGWATEDNPMPGGGVYTIASIDGKQVAAVYAAQQGPPAWLSYVTVDDADAAAATARELGANVITEPLDVMDAGRMAVIQDPTGAVFAVWQARGSVGAELVNGHGRLSLNQLNTADPDSAQRFYIELFGWRFEAVAGGPSPYWGIYRGDRLNAGMMELPAGFEGASHWLVYFGIDDIDAAAERVGASGGTLTVPKTDVPGGSIVVIQDPQGAVFGLFAGNFDD